MNKQIDPWDGISGLIALEKKTALDDFRRREFVPTPLPARRQASVFELRPGRRPAILVAVAASLLLAVALLSLWLLRGNWKNVSLAPAGNGILSDSFLYAAAGQADAVPSQEKHGTVSPLFTAWADALHLAGREEEPRDDSAAAVVERGDPEEVRRKIGRAIRAGAFEQILSNLNELADEEV